MQHKFLIAGIAIIAVFCIGLVGFFAVSAGKPDGLESVLGEQGIEESQPVWNAPLNYGSDFPSALLMGMIGFSLVLSITVGYLMLTSKKYKGTK